MNNKGNINTTHVVASKTITQAHAHLIYPTCSLRNTLSPRMHIVFYPCDTTFLGERIDIFWPGRISPPFSLRVTRKGLNSPPLVLPRATALLSLSHCVSLHPFANDLACLHIVTCSLPTHSSTVGRLAAHSPRPLHLIVPTLTWENREWCFSHSCRCTAWRINSSVGMARLRSGSPLSPFCVSGAQSFLIIGCRWGFTRRHGMDWCRPSTGHKLGTKHRNI